MNYVLPIQTLISDALADRECTITIGAARIGDLVYDYEQIKIHGGSHG